MKPTLSNLFGFKLMAFAGTITQPKVGGTEPIVTGTNTVPEMTADGEPISRISAKTGEPAELGE
jgi:hypothetical protein